MTVDPKSRRVTWNYGGERRKPGETSGGSSWSRVKLVLALTNWFPIPLAALFRKLPLSVSQSGIFTRNPSYRELVRFSNQLPAEVPVHEMHALDLFAFSLDSDYIQKTGNYKPWSRRPGEFMASVRENRDITHKTVRARLWWNVQFCFEKRRIILGQLLYFKRNSTFRVVMGRQTANVTTKTGWLNDVCAVSRRLRKSTKL
ncbi:hypothetical protein DL96DRAFT_1551233 [Flagelloscypha sp. PMI_526]|nr:hypothetical protein DL96DRAFT_1551233 [Flagelloscypha sp. PMI_526]